MTQSFWRVHLQYAYDGGIPLGNALTPCSLIAYYIKIFLCKDFQKKYHISCSLFLYISQIESTYGIVTKKTYYHFIIKIRKMMQKNRTKFLLLLTKNLESVYSDIILHFEEHAFDLICFYKRRMFSFFWFCWFLCKLKIFRNDGSVTNENLTIFWTS